MTFSDALLPAVWLLLASGALFGYRLGRRRERRSAEEAMERCARLIVNIRHVERCPDCGRFGDTGPSGPYPGPKKEEESIVG